jgi:hypothetical protein
VEELKDVGALRDLSQRNIKGERGGADILERGVRNLFREKTPREFVGEVREGKIGELRQSSAREMRELCREVETTIGSESPKNTV